MTLTEEEVAYAVNWCCCLVEGRWIESEILKAPDEAAAIKVLKQECRWAGHSAPGRPTLRGEHNGVRVLTDDGRHDWVTWREIVRRVRTAPGRQLTLW